MSWDEMLDKIARAAQDTDRLAQIRRAGIVYRTGALREPTQQPEQSSDLRHVRKRANGALWAADPQEEYRRQKGAGEAQREALVRVRTAKKGEGRGR